ncbi:hypothetical protein JHK86_002180 [Glycine max]|nr:hypothetical protein JHK86_002180 [Glycine max]|eukprot:XP_003517275.2 methylesterase 3 isoform X2 [Glycine max]
MEFLLSLAEEEQVILVGHSFGGLCISVAMELFPTKIAAAVFVSAWLPSPDLNYLDLLQEYKSRSEFNSIMLDENTNNHQNGSRAFDPQFLASNTYQLSPSGT